MCHDVSLPPSHHSTQQCPISTDERAWQPSRCLNCKKRGAIPIMQMDIFLNGYQFLWHYYSDITNIYIYIYMIDDIKFWSVQFCHSNLKVGYRPTGPVPASCGNSLQLWQIKWYWYTPIIVYYWLISVILIKQIPNHMHVIIYIYIHIYIYIKYNKI